MQHFTFRMQLVYLITSMFLNLLGFQRHVCVQETFHLKWPEAPDPTFQVPHRPEESGRLLSGVTVAMQHGASTRCFPTVPEQGSRGALASERDWEATLLRSVSVCTWSDFGMVRHLPNVYYNSSAAPLVRVRIYLTEYLNAFCFWPFTPLRNNFVISLNFIIWFRSRYPIPPCPIFFTFEISVKYNKMVSAILTFSPPNVE